MNLISFLLLFICLQYSKVNATVSVPSLLTQKYVEEALQRVPKTGKCYSEYLEVTKEIVDTYQQDLQNCQENEKGQLEALSDEGQHIRDNTTESIDKICDILNKCKEEEENLNFFDCVDNSGDGNVRGMWKASKDSSETAAHIRNQLQVIKAEAEQCSSKAERVYIVGIEKATSDLIACNARGGDSSDRRKSLVI